MVSSVSLVFALTLGSLSLGGLRVLGTLVSSGFDGTCDAIAAAISNSSQVFFPGTLFHCPPNQEYQPKGAFAEGAPQYAADNKHMFQSSSAASACSVEPGSVQDISQILGVLGATRTPFAVKGAGHATNPGFSSTSGVEVALIRFKELNIDTAAGTVDLGAGLTWDEVYAALNSSGFNVVGGRIPTVGVAGLTLGGGYSFMSSQSGLALDNIIAFELVMPNGTVTTVTSENADLWFALRGGLNNFGVVTRFTLKLYPQGQVWGGTLNLTSSQLEAAKQAILAYQPDKDVKAAVSPFISYSPEGVVPSFILFYDGPTPPPGIFDDFLAIPTNASDVSTRSFTDLISSLSYVNAPPGRRGYYNGIPTTQYSRAVVDAIVNQTLVWGTRLSALDESLFFSTAMEPFNSGLLSHGSDSAYPPDRSLAVLPTVVNLAYSNSALDDIMAGALREYSDSIQAAAVADGQNVSSAAPYINYALFDTPLDILYGDNLPRLRTIRELVDPEDVMGLAGGFKI
ncbi:FAD-binding domain-containing protein [Gloeopeniophorella convolvens]|nr:FAD-binding domain-containing protein [Gloeopeniophorella convolvens]